LILVWSAIVTSGMARSSRRWRRRAPKLSCMRQTVRVQAREPVEGE
jgi:hypothetical protein